MPGAPGEMTDKRPVGRPSSYDPAYCEKVIELGKAGKSQVQIACALEVPRTTLLRWADDHEEFRTALTRAKDCEQNWWEEKGMNAVEDGTMTGPGATVWKKSMEARFRNDYTERKELAHDGEMKVSFQTVYEAEPEE